MNARPVFRTLIVISLLLIVVPFSVKSQDDDSKAIKAEVFIKARPTRTSRNSAKYKPVAKSNAGGATNPPEGMVFAQMGLTMWRFRRSKATDKTKELVEEDEGQKVEWTLERVPEGTLLSPGQRVRLSFESLSRTGYLYVVDREEYADGSFGDPILIYPTQKSVDDYRVEPGRLTYIPSTTGRFRIKPSESEKKQVAESITFIVSPKPLIDEGQLGSKSIKLLPQQFEEWQKQWTTSASKFEMEGGPGQAMTSAEQSAARQGSPLLTQEDPVPQTVYQVAIKPEAPLLIVVPLRFSKEN